MGGEVMSFRDDLVERATDEWDWFGEDKDRNDKYIGPDGKTTTNKGAKKNPNRRKETVEPFASRIADYWLAIPSKDYDRLVKLFAKAEGKLDGTVNIAWSAAFISYCMQTAGAGSSFPYASGHATWMIKAIKNKKAGKLNAALVGYKPGEIPLEVGDLIGRPREGGVTYDNAAAKGWFESHSDIVVEVDKGKKLAYVIGGNVGQSVSKAEVKITADGKLKDPGGWIVHIQNNIEMGTPVANATPAVAPKDAKVG
jgi:hypothetical protein